MAEKTLNTRILLRSDTKANWDANESVILKKGEAGVETDTGFMKVGDGVKTWKNLPYLKANESQISDLIADKKETITEVVPTSDSETDAQALARVITDPTKGKMAVVKREIGSGTGKYTYTGYVYNGTAWGAMDGNYSAENVFLSEDITMAGNYEQVGNLTKTKSGRATFSTKGKSVAAALTEIFSKRLQPKTPTAPTANFKTYAGISDATVEPGTQKSGTVSYELQLASAGSYEYGPATGITENGTYSITYNDGTTAGQTKSTKSGSFDYNVVVGTSDVEIGVTASSVGHTEGAVAKDNLGDNSDPVVKIASGTISAGTKSNKFTSSRKSFYHVDNTTGTSLDQSDETKKAQVSNMIRNLTGEFGTKLTYGLSIAEGINRVILVVPGTHTMTSCIDVEGLGLDIKANFSTTYSIKVGGADATSSAIGSYPADYTVFLYENLAGLKSTTYNITLA